MYLRLTATQILDGHGGVTGLLLAQQQRIMRSAAIRALELRLEATASAIAFDSQSGVAQALGKRKALLFGDFTQ